jgi:hypothetical protein
VIPRPARERWVGMRKFTHAPGISSAGSRGRAEVPEAPPVEPELPPEEEPEPPEPPVREPEEEPVPT